MVPKYVLCYVSCTIGIDVYVLLIKICFCKADGTDVTTLQTAINYFCL
jgi:hypothetical protein